MSSDIRIARLALLALASTAVVVSLAACGKQGDPRPRPRAIPRPANDLVVRQRGLELLFEVGYPKTTVAGLPIQGLANATLFEAVATPLADNKAPALGAAELQGLAKPIVELSGPALAEAVVGDKIRFRVALPSDAFETPQAHVFAVRTVEARGLTSPFSNTVGIVPVAPPPPPTDLRVEPKKDGVELGWAAAEGAVGYVVLRREATDPLWGAPLASVGVETFGFLDRGALYGTRYVYTVLSLAASSPPVESAPQSASEVDYRDLFAPDPPTELRVLWTGGRVRLVWEPSPDADLDGYRIERSLAGDNWTTVDGLATGTDGFDPSPISGLVRYRLTAIDRSGNVGVPTEPVEIAVP